VFKQGRFFKWHLNCVTSIKKIDGKLSSLVDSDSSVLAFGIIGTDPLPNSLVDPPAF
jgi:hypothetical protein